jgi:hypothetical protein
MHRLSLLLALLAPAWAQPGPSLRGTLTDPSGAWIAGTIIQLRGPAREERANTDQYAFPRLAPGKYQVRITAKGFSAAQKKDSDIQYPQILRAQLAIQGEAQVVIPSTYNRKIDLQLRFTF